MKAKTSDSSSASIRSPTEPHSSCSDPSGNVPEATMSRTTSSVR